MVWTTTYVKKLRYLIGDIDAVPTYTHDQLQNFLAVAAEYVFDATSIYGITGFVVSFAAEPATITPDPQDTAPIAISNLICLYAACLITGYEVKMMLVSSGLKIIDNKSTIDLTGKASSAKLKQNSLDMFKKQYEEVLNDFELGNRYAGCGIFNIYESNN